MGDFPGAPEAKTWLSNAEGVSLIPGWGAKISGAVHQKKKKVQLQTEAILS